MSTPTGLTEAVVSGLKLSAAETAVLPQLLAAASWIAKADAVLVVAGAGMSGHPKDAGYNVYVNPEDFARAYPGLLRYGYKTCYECMGLMGDPRVPENVKAGYLVAHMQNMRWGWPMNEGYAALREMLADKDYFVHTSNVDGHFLRAGFDPDRLYRPQGDWEHYQCLRRCREDAIWKSRTMLDAKLPLLDHKKTALPADAVPKCPHCGGPVFGNVRGGDWFIHSPYAKESQRAQEWLRRQLEGKRRLVVLEVGAGFNTPTVTRWPAESIALEGGTTAGLVRLNPTDNAVPSDIAAAVGLGLGWESLASLRRLVGMSRASGSDAEELRRAMARVDEALRRQRAAAAAGSGARRLHGKQGMQEDGDLWKKVEARYGHFDWRIFLEQLAD